jgi:hypothetical protein
MNFILAPPPPSPTPGIQNQFRSHGGGVCLYVWASIFYVTDGNIMYLTDASRFLISCVIQHYAPVVGWGGGGTDA